MDVTLERYRWVMFAFPSQYGLVSPGVLDDGLLPSCLHCEYGLVTPGTRHESRGPKDSDSLLAQSIIFCSQK